MSACPVCGAEAKRTYCSQRCWLARLNAGQHGQRNRNWRGGRSVMQSGRVLVRAAGNPEAKYQGYGLEHRVVMAAHLGRALEKGEHVHHVNGDPSDNRIDNLRLLSHSEHAALHNSERKGHKYRPRRKAA